MSAPMKCYAQRLRAAADALDALDGDKPTPTRKDELLKYCLQFDAFTRDDGLGLEDYADDAGHVVMSTAANELHASVRVQIRTGTPATLAAALLVKILASVRATAECNGSGAFKLSDWPAMPNPPAGAFDEELPF